MQIPISGMVIPSFTHINKRMVPPYSRAAKPRQKFRH
jgi:hypothetical protein